MFANLTRQWSKYLIKVEKLPKHYKFVYIKIEGAWTGAVVRVSDFGPRGPGFEPRPGAVRCSLELVTFTPCLVLVKPRKRWTDNRHGQTVTRLETMLCLMC